MFVCSECAAREHRWAGRCPRCGAWGSLESIGERVAAPERRPIPLAEIEEPELGRIPTGNRELDRVLGGGMVPGSVVLVGGEPGIGKSTLMLGLGATADCATLFVAGEESPAQVAARARRLGIEKATLLVYDETDTRQIAETLRRDKPALCIIDSVQTLRDPEVKGAPGGPAQMKAAGTVLVPVARETNCALFLVGQVTKEGGLAGPLYLEHTVDTVLLFEGDRQTSMRALRGVKNRFGATDEIGLFEMREQGLREVRDASGWMLQCRGTAGPGSVVGVVVEGRRALCVEVQALLVGEGRLQARRRATGLDARRVDQLVGVVESLFADEVSKRDVFLNVTGGWTIKDPGLDLAVAAAVLGAHRGLAVDPRAVVIGEIGLRGEVRPVPRTPARLKEARALGFRRAYVPATAERMDGIECIPVERLDEVLQLPEVIKGASPGDLGPGHAAQTRRQ